MFQIYRMATVDGREYSELQTFLCFQRPSEDQLWLLRSCPLRVGESYRAPGPATTHQKHGCKVAIRSGPDAGSNCQNIPKPAFSASILGGKIFLETGKSRLYTVPGKNEGLNLGIWGWLHHLDSLGRCHQLKKKLRPLFSIGSKKQ